MGVTGVAARRIEAASGRARGVFRRPRRRAAQSSPHGRRRVARARGERREGASTACSLLGARWSTWVGDTAARADDHGESSACRCARRRAGPLDRPSRSGSRRIVPKAGAGRVDSTASNTSAKRNARASPARSDRPRPELHPPVSGSTVARGILGARFIVAHRRRHLRRLAAGRRASDALPARAANADGCDASSSTKIAPVPQAA